MDPSSVITETVAAGAALYAGIREIGYRFQRRANRTMPERMVKVETQVSINTETLRRVETKIDALLLRDGGHSGK